MNDSTRHTSTASFWRRLSAASICLLSVGLSPSRAAELSDVVMLVDEAGSPVDLKGFCGAFDIGDRAEECMFKQITAEEWATGYIRAFSSPLRASGQPPYLLLFHITPDIGEIFVFSPSGVLLKAFRQLQRAGYRPASVLQAQREFDLDLAYWTENLAFFQRELDQRRAGER